LGKKLLISDFKYLARPDQILQASCQFILAVFYLVKILKNFPIKKLPAFYFLPAVLLV